MCTSPLEGLQFSQPFGALRAQHSSQDCHLGQWKTWAIHTAVSSISTSLIPLPFMTEVVKCCKWEPEGMGQPPANTRLKWEGKLKGQHFTENRSVAFKRKEKARGERSCKLLPFNTWTDQLGSLGDQGSTVND